MQLLLGQKSTVAAKLTLVNVGRLFDHGHGPSRKMIKDQNPEQTFGSSHLLFTADRLDLDWPLEI